jgi:hypothetical protein
MQYFKIKTIWQAIPRVKLACTPQTMLHFQAVSTPYKEGVRASRAIERSGGRRLLVFSCDPAESEAAS